MKCLTSSFALVCLVGIGVLSQWSAIDIRVLLSPLLWCLRTCRGCSENLSGELSAVCPSLTTAEAALGCYKVPSLASLKNTGNGQAEQMFLLLLLTFQIRLF